MRVLFLTEYFYPYIHGGAEISIGNLGKELVRKGIDIHLLTPNYGSLEKENIDGVNIKRFWFPKKLKNSSDQLTPFWHFNPLYWMVLAYEIFILVKKNNIDVIHCHSAMSIIPGVIAGKFLNKNVVITFRDNQILCNYGYCLTKNQFGKTCDLSHFITEDFAKYYEDKVKSKNIISMWAQLILGLQGRFRSKTIKLFAKLSAVNVVGSRSQQRTFKVNGIEAEVINNIYHFTKIEYHKISESRSLLYATKLSSGKGLNLLFESLKEILSSYPKLELKVVGAGDIEFYKKLAKELNIHRSVSFLGRLDQVCLTELRKKSLIEIVPSIYPESFGRSALEAIGVGLPVVCTNMGGLTDIVENGVTGIIVEPTVKDLCRGIAKAVKSNNKLRSNIKGNYDNLKYMFEIKPLEDYIKLYNNIL